MGYSSTGILAFGFLIGGPDSGWHIKEYDEDEYRLNIPWLTDEMIENYSYKDVFERRLLEKVVGFTEKWSDNAINYWARERDAENKLGVEIAHYGSDNYAGYILAAHVISVYDYGANEIVVPAVTTENLINLGKAIEALEITPKSDPGWILGSYYG